MESLNEERIQNKGREILLLETRDMRWHAFYKGRPIAESFSRRHTLSEAEKSIDRRIARIER